MHVIACNEIYYIVLQIHYMSLHRGGFADAGHGCRSAGGPTVYIPPAVPSGAAQGAHYPAGTRGDIQAVTLAQGPAAAAALAGALPVLARAAVPVTGPWPWHSDCLPAAGAGLPSRCQ